jgi:tetratricopeptide (TPR) repeat protein
MSRLLLWILLLAPGWAQPITADQALAQQRWSEAVPLLQERAKSAGGQLYYNLGLCYQHLNDLGRARAYYQASLQRNPWNSGLHNNLALLKADLSEPEPDESWSDFAGHCAPPALLAATMVGFSWASCGLAWLYRRRARERWLWSGLASYLLACLAGGLWAAALLQPTRAAVLPETATLMNGPGSEFSQSLNVHAGNLVEVVREQGDWVEVEALGKVRAWIRRDQLLWVP